jgi:superfamily II DNA or RNA helicase
MPDHSRKITEITNRLNILENEKIRLHEELKLLTVEEEKCNYIPNKPTQSQFSSEEKLTIFLDLFKGRDEVFPKRWVNAKKKTTGYSPACRNEWVPGICNKPKIKCGECSYQAFIPLTKEIAHKHLIGERVGQTQRDHTIGIYPLRKDETCWFLAADFDKEEWQRDVAAFLETCERKNIPASLERSRSGRGGHIWIFFSEPVPAMEARKMGAALLTETMERYPHLGFESYDRFFPNQDTMPSGGFGNLIALPFQWQAREQGNSVFLDKNFNPYDDQWAYLASIRKMSAADVFKIVCDAATRGQILGVRIPIDDNGEKPWETPPSGLRLIISPDQKLPASVELVLGNQLYINKEDLPPVLMNKLIRLAAFQNPEFYQAQALRFSTFNKPRIIACAENFQKQIGLPRGCMDEAIALLESLNIVVKIEDKRFKGTRIKTRFLGKLTSDQKKATKELLQFDTGVLAATTGFGKTVIAANIIAKRATNTLILVHSTQLLDQWLASLKTFLDIPADHIGRIGGGKRKPTSRIDVALIQSLIKNDIVNDCVADYGQLIVDECHHLSAKSFEKIARACKAKYVLGLTATATRKDGRHPIIFMQCGPIRHKVNAKQQAALRPFSHKVIIRNTNFQIAMQESGRAAIQKLYSAIILDDPRNHMIYEDVLKVLADNRTPLLLTERKEHALSLAEHFKKVCPHVIVMIGGQTAKAREEIRHKLASIPETETRLIIATGRYIGEGFDDARLDTLFLTMPISWHGTLAQYAGRLHRLHHAKKEVIVYDYADHLVPQFEKMARKRIKGYQTLGYEFAK